MREILAYGLLLLGMLLLVVAAIGLVRLPDALSRQHAATKAGTLALAVVLAGAAVLMEDSGGAWRAVMIVVVLFATLPVASHVLARAALKRRGP